MHNNVIIGLVVLTAFTLSIMLALYGMRFVDRDRQWRPRRYGLSARGVLCSFCGKSVRAEAIMCRHCHHRLDEVIDDQAEMLDGAMAEVADGLLSPEKRLVPATTGALAIENEDLSKNQAFMWLDSAFAQLALKPAPAAWGPAAADPTIVQEQPSPSLQRDALDVGSTQLEAMRENEVLIRPIGPVSQQPVLDTQKARTWFAGWTSRKEWAFAAGIAAVALIVGGSTFLVGPSSSRVEKPDEPDEYVSFDVSERAPLYTGPEAKEAKAEPPIKAAVPVPAVTAPVVKPDAVVTATLEPAAESPKPAAPMIALPEMPQVPAAVKAETETPASLAAITPSQSTASDPGRVAPRPRVEDWASSVSRAIKPAQSKDLIVVVQRLIRAEGYDPGTIDGTVGPRTRRAIQQYQRNGGLPPTGEIDRDLLVKLNLADRTVRVVGPLSGVATPARSTAKPAVEWTK